ncbi:acyl-CoA thioesterase [Marivirga sp. S37H4]|uniref:Acyl-CoA thioesterase n=1 Tax=Marivirga aurantiaca TaxID=2802615 RepID=A0A934X0L5_9BACT|nr:thioesterase family protein [Marivirga aurantiaca]MBK6266738.1 acyl-CoA thioesterase [Marivirga aurantiaca]
MYLFEHKLRVRYAETDQMGYCYYGNYSTYYEVARVESIRSHGLSYKKIEEEGVIMPVFENHSKFFRPALYDDELLIRLSIHEKPGVKIKYHYEIFKEEVLIHKGYTVLVFVNKASGKPCQIPPLLADVLNPFFDEV